VDCYPFLYGIIKEEVIRVCGRFTVSYSYDELLRMLQEDFEIDSVDLYDGPRYNVAPQQEIYVITYDGNYHLEKKRWGYVPTFNPSLRLINIRSESIHKGNFKDGFMNHKCLIIATGFYEWDQGKKPYYFSLDKSFMFAGMYQEDSVGIFTTSANNAMSEVHDQMPALIEKGQYESYLKKTFPSDLLVPYEKDDMIKYPVSKRVNNVKNDDSTLLKEEVEYTLF